MDAAHLEKLAADFTLESPLNRVVMEQSGEALTLFDPPCWATPAPWTRCLRRFWPPASSGRTTGRRASGLRTRGR